MRRKASNPWTARADEILADGQWHSGRELMAEAEKAILPGVALRYNENDRVNAGRRSPPDRKVVRGTDTLISMGKRAIVQTMVHTKIRSGSWQVRPWPVPEPWSAGQWEIRDLRVSRITLTEAAIRHGMSVARLREMILRDPPIAHEMMGRVMHLYDLDAIAERVEMARSESYQRRSAASRAAAEARRSRPPTKVSLTELARRDGLSVRTARELCEGSPELGWDRTSAVTTLPVEQLPKWDEVVAMYRADAFVRRSTAAKLSQERQRERRAGQSP